MKTNTSSITTIITVLGPLGSLVFLTATSTLHAGQIDFDGPGYVVGQRPPPPWFCASDLNGTSTTVFQVTGTLGAQYLAVQDGTHSEGESGYYPFPRALRVEDGAQHITVRVAPPNAASGMVAGCGFVGIAFGVGTNCAAVNRIGFGGNDTTHLITGSRYSGDVGWIDGEDYGQFQPGLWHEVTFDLNTDWTELTISVKRPDGTIVSNIERVTSAAYDVIICGGSWDGGYVAERALFDDLRWPKYRATFDSIKPTTGGIELKMFGERGQVYDLEHTADLAGAWQTLTTLTNTAWTMTHTDTTATNYARFYRLHEK